MGARRHTIRPQATAAGSQEARGAGDQENDSGGRGVETIHGPEWGNRPRGTNGSTQAKGFPGVPCLGPPIPVLE